MSAAGRIVSLERLEEARKIFRQLSRDGRPKAGSHLASCLYNESLSLQTLRRYEESLDRIDEAVELRRAQAERLPTVFTSYLVRCLLQRARITAEMDHPDETSLSLDEALRRIDVLAVDAPEVHDTLTRDIEEFRAELMPD